MRFLLFLPFFLICTLPCQAASQTSYEQGKNLFLSGNYRQARAVLFNAFKENPADPDINFYLGRSAFELGDFETALMAFERILIMNPNAVRVKLEIARCHLGLGFKEMAKQYFREVLATNPPQSVWRNIERYLAAIEKEDKRHFFTGTFTFGINWDDNVRLSPVNDIIPFGLFDLQLTGPSAKPQDDQFYSTTAIFNHVYRLDNDAVSWKSTFTNYNAFYENQQDLDINFYSLSTGPVWKAKNFMWNNYAIIKHIDVEHDRYQGAYGFGSVLTVPVGHALLLNFDGRIEKRDNYPDSLRDSTDFRLNLNPVISLGSNRISILLFKEGEKTDADFYSFDRIGWTLHFERALHWKTAAFASIGCQQTDYDEADPLFLIKRSDAVQELKLGLSKLIWQSESDNMNLSSQLIYTYTDSESNMDIYTYRKNLVTLSFTLGFF
ncbi:MAG: tetratricopeptide repeat protein [Desulfobulbaceae bacterium]|nr:tetratricopeptide repeat protein [Desulfobulbaceae bacterium]